MKNARQDYSDSFWIQIMVRPMHEKVKLISKEKSWTWSLQKGSNSKNLTEVRTKGPPLISMTMNTVKELQSAMVRDRYTDTDGKMMGLTTSRLSVYTKRSCLNLCCKICRRRVITTYFGATIKARSIKPIRVLCSTGANDTFSKNFCSSKSRTIVSKSATGFKINVHMFNLRNIHMQFDSQQFPIVTDQWHVVEMFSNGTMGTNRTTKVHA